MGILGKMTASDARRVSACAGHFTIERVPLATMRPTIVLTLLLLTLVTTQACSGGAPTQEALETAMVAALDTLVAELVAERPADAAAYAERLRAYLEAHPAFYGSNAALLDEAGNVTASPTSIARTTATMFSILPSPITTSRRKSGSRCH